MDFRRAINFSKHKKRASAAVALAVALVLTSYNWREQKEWLGEVTLEVQVSSAPNMGRSAPTKGALLLRRTNAKEKVLQSKDWTSTTAKPISRLRFDFPQGHYDRVIFFPDPILQEAEIRAVRLIPHGGGNATNVLLDRVQSEQSFVTADRTPEAVTFKRPGGAPLIAIALGIADVLEQVPAPPSPSLVETIFVFLAVFLGSYACALFVFGSSTTRARPGEGESLRVPFVRFGIIIGLVACMAAAAPDNSHPDEYLHLETARYYLHHWLPPALDNEWVVPSFSHYGVSYLMGTDVGYLVAGKFALICHGFFPDFFATLRFFNVVLLVVILLWSARVFRESRASWIFLLTPQLWYVFSAYNTEGWALFVALLLIGQIASKDSSLHAYLASPQSQTAVTRLLPALSLVCLLALSKANFLIVFFFFATWLVWRLTTVRAGARGLHGVARIIPLIVLPLLLQFGAQKYRHAVNHGDLESAILRQAEKYAQREFKPSALQMEPKRFPGLQMKARGVSFQDVLIRQQWLYRTAASFFGTYGWMTVTSPPLLYFLMGLGWIIFLAGALVATFRKSAALDQVFYATAWLYLPLMATIAAYYSWTSDFQPQGRYLFPFLPILFYLIHKVDPRRRLMAATVWMLFLLSAYGFIFVGLRALAHT